MSAVEQRRVAKAFGAVLRTVRTGTGVSQEGRAQIPSPCSRRVSWF
jgi:hypothetical protein